MYQAGFIWRWGEIIQIGRMIMQNPCIDGVGRSGPVGKKLPFNQVREELERTAPDLMQACAVHLETIEQISRIVTAMLKEDEVPPVTIFSRRTEAANFVANMIEKRKAEGRSRESKSEAADRIIARIYADDDED